MLLSNPKDSLYASFLSNGFTSPASEVCDYCTLPVSSCVLYDPLHATSGMWRAMRGFWLHRNKERKITWTDTLRPQATGFTTGTGAVRLEVLYVVLNSAHTSPSKRSKAQTRCQPTTKTAPAGPPKWLLRAPQNYSCGLPLSRCAKQRSRAAEFNVAANAGERHQPLPPVPHQLSQTRGAARPAALPWLGRDDGGRAAARPALQLLSPRPRSEQRALALPPLRCLSVGLFSPTLYVFEMG